MQESGKYQINYLDSNKWSDYSSKAKDGQVVGKELRCRHSLELYPGECKRDQHRNYQSIEYDCRKYGRLRGCKTHYIQNFKLRIDSYKGSRNDCEVLGDIICNRKGCQGSASHQD